MTPLEPEWEGHVTLEFQTLPISLQRYGGEAQLFSESDDVKPSYADRKGNIRANRCYLTCNLIIKATDSS